MGCAHGQTAPIRGTDGCHGIDKLVPQGHQESETEQQKRQDRGAVDGRKIGSQAGTGVDGSDDQNHAEDQNPNLSWTLVQRVVVAETATGLIKNAAKGGRPGRLKLVQSIESGHLIGFGHSGIIEHGIAEIFDASSHG